MAGTADGEVWSSSESAWVDASGKHSNTDDGCVWFFFFFSSRRRHTRSDRDWSSDVCSSDLAVCEDRGLGVMGRRQLLFRSLEHQPAEAEAERLVDRVERVPRGREPLGQILAHPDFLRALPRAEPRRGSYHRTTVLAQVKPAPKAQNISFMPAWTRPHRTASSSAIATDAADVLPKRSTFTYTLSIGRPACFAVASMIRMLAWWGMRRSMSPAASPARASALSQASAIERTAALNTSRPALLML